MPAAQKFPTTGKPMPNGININNEIIIGRIEPTATKAYEISLIDSNGQQYISLRQQYKKKANPSWMPKKVIWIPFVNGEEISHIMQRACAEGKKRNWGTTPAQPIAQTPVPSIDVEKELLEVKEKLERLENQIHQMEANTEQKAQLKLIERILKALS